VIVKFQDRKALLCYHIKQTAFSVSKTVQQWSTTFALYYHYLIIIPVCH